MNATKVNAGPAESNGRLLLGIWRDTLHVTCGLTACTPGSAPGATLGNEYGKTLPLYHTDTESDAEPGVPGRLGRCDIEVGRRSCRRSGSGLAVFSRSRARSSDTRPAPCNVQSRLDSQWRFHAGAGGGGGTGPQIVTRPPNLAVLLTHCGQMITSRSIRNRSFRGRFAEPISWLGMENELNLTQQKHTLTNQKRCTTTQNKTQITRARFSRLLRHHALETERVDSARKK